MFQVHLLSALYVTAPPVREQKLFDNNVTTTLINFSEYLFSIPCRYPSYVVSLDLNLTQVQSSTLKRVGLAALWFLMARFWKSTWKVGAIFAAIKVGNRLGFIEPPSPQTFPRRGPTPYLPPRSPAEPDFIYPTIDPTLPSPSKRNELEPLPSPSVEPSDLGSFLIVDPPQSDPRQLPSLPSSSLAGSFVTINSSEDSSHRPVSSRVPDERDGASLLSKSWVVLEEEDSKSSSGSEASSLSSGSEDLGRDRDREVRVESMGSFVLLDSYVAEEQ